MADTLTLYNTLTRRKERFEPLDPKNVRMYVCGPTVYDFAHIGNARPVIVFDVLFRLLRHLAKQGVWDGGKGETKVTYVRNITDVDDKINARAAEEGVPIRELTERTAKQFHDDIRALGVLTAEDVNKPGEPLHFVEPRATEYIRREDGRGDMVSLIEALVANGHAYVAEDHVLFHVPSMPDYGRLSNRSLEEMEAGARVEVAPYKKDPMDFVLWKPSKPGEPSWPSPSGIKAPGRPGWHIECSAMAGALLGDVFDIHGGGIDLVFPHHENEIAQSRCAHGTDVMARFWLHNGFLQVEGEKMSKSLGNFVTIHELLGDFHGTVLRYNMLRTHYRQPIDWKKSELERARHELWKWSDILTSMAVESEFNQPPRDRVDARVLSALSDDLNTPKAFGVLHELASASLSDRDSAKTFAATAGFLGLKHLDVRGNFTDSFVSSVPDDKMADYMAAHAAILKFKNYSANGMPSIAKSYADSLEERGIKPSFDEKYLTISFGNDVETVEQKIERLKTERDAARKAKNFAKADRIRKELADMGIALKDSKDPKTGEIVTTWEVAR